MKKVVVYTLPSCVQCDSTKKYLDRKQIIYETVDLSQDSQAMEHVRQLGYSQAPVVEFEDRHWSGFRMADLDNLVKRIHGDNAKP